MTTTSRQPSHLLSGCEVLRQKQAIRVCTTLLAIRQTESIAGCPDGQWLQTARGTSKRRKTLVPRDSLLIPFSGRVLLTQTKTSILPVPTYFIQLITQNYNSLVTMHRSNKKTSRSATCKDEIFRALSEAELRQARRVGCMEGSDVGSELSPQ